MSRAPRGERFVARTIIRAIINIGRQRRCYRTRVFLLWDDTRGLTGNPEDRRCIEHLLKGKVEPGSIELMRRDQRRTATVKTEPTNFV